MENTHIEPPPFVSPGDAPVNEPAAVEPAAVEPEVEPEARQHDPEPENDAPARLPDDVAALGLSASLSERIGELLRNAEAEGYLRGRNEKIEATQHFDPDPDLDPQPTGIPIYSRRSVWD